MQSEKEKDFTRWKSRVMIQEEWAYIQMLMQVTNEDSSNTWFLSNAYLGETS